MNILLADKHEILRQGVKLILQGEFEDVYFGEAEDCDQVISMAGNQVWDLIVLDLSIPRRGGLDVMRMIFRDYSKTPVLMLSRFSDLQFVVRAFRAGARGCLTNSCDGGELIVAVQRILSGKRYVSPAQAEQLAAMVGANCGRKLDEKLSDREFWILRMLATGKIVSEIADELRVSCNTISTYRARILKKMGMDNNVDLIRYAINNNLVR